MQTTNLAVCNMGLFGESVGHFWMDKLDGLLEKFPCLELPHRQYFHTLLLVEEAEGELLLDNQIIPLDSAKAFIIKPRCINSINIKKEAKGRIICFMEDFFSLRYNNNILYQFRFLQQEEKPYTLLTKTEYKQLNILLELLESEFRSDKKQSLKVMRSYLNIILFELERIFNTSEPATRKSPKQEKIHQFKTLISQYFKTKKTPSAYAELLNVSPNYLNKICKEQTGQTAGDLIRKEITVEAQRLLYYTNHSIKEIADLLGFENTSYFTAFFKKQTEVSPEKFRSQN